MAPETWSRFVDDASPLPETGRVPRRPSPAVGARVVRDVELSRLRDYAGDVHVVLGGGAGSLAGPAAYCTAYAIELTGLEVALRDHADPVGNARRVVAAVDAARGDGALADDVVVHLVMADPTPSWLAAADEAAAAGLALTLRLDLLDPAALETWIDAALDRELPFALTGGTAADAVAALRVTARLWGDPDDLLAARRWCRSWATGDVDTALDHLA